MTMGSGARQPARKSWVSKAGGSAVGQSREELASPIVVSIGWFPPGKLRHGVDAMQVMAGEYHLDRAKLNVAAGKGSGAGSVGTDTGEPQVARAA